MISTRVGFERLVLPLQDSLFHAALAMTRREADALDLVQDALLKAWRSAGSFNRGDNLKAWLFTILRNAYLDRCRTRRAEPAPLEDTAGPLDTDAAPAALEEILPDELLRALRGLTPAHQLLLQLCDLEGLSYREIADVLGCPLGSVMSGLHNARTRLREKLRSR